MKRGGAVLVTGMLGALGWVGSQQFSASPAFESDGVDEALVFEGETTESLEVPPLRAPRQTMQLADATGTRDVSPFETSPAAFRREPARRSQESDVLDHSVETEPANPFAAFARPAAPAERDIEPPAARKPSFGRADTGVVTLASNETGAHRDDAATLMLDGPARPEAIAVRSMQQEPHEPAASAPVAIDDDPFAAFAAAPPMSPERHSAPGTFDPPVHREPAPFNSTPFNSAQRNSAQYEPAQYEPTTFDPASYEPAQYEPVPVETQWSAEPAPPEVTPAQFQLEPAPLQTGGGIEVVARPIEPVPQFEATAASTSPYAGGDWSGFDHQPAAAEPAQPRGSGRSPYSPATSRVQPSRFQVPQPAGEAADPGDEQLHVVQQGETYWSIARQHYGEARYFQALAEYNKPRISEQTALKPGMKVLVPSAETLDARFGRLMQASGQAKPPAKPLAGLRFDAQGQPFYVVGEGDTLGDIARRYLGRTLRSEEIYRLNEEQLPNPNRLKAGMTLVMPADAAETPATGSRPGGR